MEYRVIKSNRKTIGIEIKNGELIVRSPYGISDRVIQSIVKEKQDWIEQKLSSIKQYDFSLESGSMIPFLGFMMRIQFGDFDKIFTEDGFLYVPTDMTIERLEKWFRVQAERKLLSRFKSLSRGYPVKNVRLSNARTRYGSCNNKGNINLSWRLIFCPEYVIDYIIIHELTHLEHLNHSKFFWNSVEKVMPEYRMAERWLKENNVMSLF